MNGFETPGVLMGEEMTQDKLHIDSAAISDKGLSEKRPQNEDSYLELRDSGFYAVADGVGGAQAGDVASQMAMEILGEAFINLPDGGDAEERLKLAVEQANQAIYQMSRDLPQLSTMATTVVGLHVDGNVATIGHVGDSRLYRVGPNGNLYRETQDHSVVEEEVRAGRMTPQQAEIHPSRNVISRALGAEETVEIDLKTIMFEPGTTFMLCSDGVTRHLTDDELQELLANEADPFAACNYIKDVCYERGAEDNLTAVIVKASSVVEGAEPAVEDVEEETVASARPPLVDSSLFSEAESPESLADTLEIPDERPRSGGIEAIDELDLDDITIPAATEEESTVSILDEEQQSAPVAIASEPAQSEDIKTFRVEDKGTIGTVGKLVTFLPWILLAGVLAFGAYYIWSTSQPSDGVSQLQSQSQDVSLTAFEQNRRNVDSNPAQYVAVNSANPKDAVDYYLLGRAYFLQQNYESAKNHLERAKSLLPERVSETNKKVLENEIPMLLSIIEVDEAKKSFESAIGAGDGETKEENKGEN